jgi:NTE family protein
MELRSRDSAGVARAMGEPSVSQSDTGQRSNVLVLQGGGALGSYQAGVYAALEAGCISLSWIAGVSIGAVNAAIIAGNPQEARVSRLRAFWETITKTNVLVPDVPYEAWRTLYRQGAAAAAVAFGQPGFFRPRRALEWVLERAPISYYDTSELGDTLRRLVDFDYLNRPGGTRLSVGAVDVETGNMVYFDSLRQRIEPEHIMASGALPPGLAIVSINGRHYWDGGLVSNTPLQYVMDFEPRKDMLIFQIDLFSANGKLPENLDEVAEREKDIR